MEVQDLCVTIDSNKILKNVSISFPKNKITCVVGPSGCGKSTLLKCLNRLIDNTLGAKLSGRVMVDGQDLLKARDSELIDLRRRIGLVPQRPCPLPMSIFDNVAYGCRIHGMHRGKSELADVVETYLREG